MEFTYHAIHSLKVHLSMAFSDSRLCNPQRDFRTLPTPPKESHTAQQSPAAPKPPPPAPSNRSRTSCLYEFAYFGHFIQMESHSPWSL